jgi:F0F1-type ATP synthase epsilon subunit
MKKFPLKLISPERILLDEEITEITAPTKSGEITILAGHESMVTQLSHEI